MEISVKPELNSNRGSFFLFIRNGGGAGAFSSSDDDEKLGGGALFNGKGRSTGCGVARSLQHGQ